MSECKHFEHGKPTETVTRLVSNCPLCEIEGLERAIERWKQEELEWIAEREATKKRHARALALLRAKADGCITCEGRGGWVALDDSLPFCPCPDCGPIRAFLKGEAGNE